MKPHMTGSWLRKYANVHKHASYQDKLDGLYNEKNPYYILEWLLFPASESEAEDIRFSRSPSMQKNSYIDFNDVFFDQIVYEVGFKAYSLIQADGLLLNTAIHDLRVHYGDKVWLDAARLWDDKLHATWLKYEEFEQELNRERQVIHDKYQEQIKEIHEIFQEDSEEKTLQLLSVQELFEQKRDETPRKLLQKKYKKWPLVSYIYFSEWTQPKGHLLWLSERLMSEDEPAYLTYMSNRDYAGLLKELEEDKETHKAFLRWFPAIASKSLMTIEYVDLEYRQNWWVGLLNYIQQNELDIQTSILEITFELKGIDEVILGSSMVPEYFDKLVSIALMDFKRRKWFREVFILRHWDVFIRAFANENYDYKSLSWVLCLDPDSLEQKLIRGLQSTKDQSLQCADLPFIVERCCEVFSDGIRAGLDTQLMEPLFKYLTIHHIDFIYFYIQKMKDISQLYPILNMDDSHVQRIFSGMGVRASTARKQLQPIFLSWLTKVQMTDSEQKVLERLGWILVTDRMEVLKEWLDVAIEQKDWNFAQAQMLEKLFRIKWLGQPGDEENEHKQVEDWLAHHSDWVKFELDSQAVNRNSVKYRIVRPGYQDLLKNQILGRVWIRAEWNDQKEITSLLDDLKNI